MKRVFVCLACLPLSVAQLAVAQTEPAVAPKEDFKPSTLNQPGQQYPMINSERYARFQ